MEDDNAIPFEVSQNPMEVLVKSLGFTEGSSKVVCDV
jgi:hypothetical protein